MIKNEIDRLKNAKTHLEELMDKFKSENMKNKADANSSEMTK